MRDYASALLTELRGRAEEYQLIGRRVDTVFFGGGTPSLLPVEWVTEILREIRGLFSLDGDTEITMEANPATADLDKLCALRTAGVNRLSVGVQSFVQKELDLLGRIHSAVEAEQFLKDARRAGFANINVDLMYAIPEQTPESLSQTLKQALALAPEHISAYGLILEPGTPLYEEYEGRSPVSADGEADMNALICRTLQQAGYRHYEISNFARAGYESRHNLRYWRCQEYLGLGVAAHSYLNGERFGNGTSLDGYLRNPTRSVAERNRLTVEDMAYERVMLGLRTADGLSCSAFLAEFGREITANADPALLRRLEDEGYLCREDDRLFLSEAGMMISNAILISFL